MTALRNRNIPTQEEIYRLQDFLGNFPSVDMPVKHHFSEGTYTREIFMPKGSTVIGKEHATRHTNIVVKGICTVWTVHGKHVYDASTRPISFESMAGVKKVLHMHTDVIWMTVHPNPTNERDQEVLERMFIRPVEQLPLFPELDMELLVKDILSLENLS
jgi:hypothetical protein